MDFGEGEEAVAIAAIFDEGGLERGLHPRHLRQIDIAPERLPAGGFEIKFLEREPRDHHDPGLFRVGGIDKHLVGHRTIPLARRPWQPAGLRM